MFKKATKLKLRFSTPKGIQSVEDLWDFPLTSAKGASLDNLAKALNKEIKANAEDSFVSAPNKGNAELELKFGIVKEIISIKLAERAAKSNATKVKEECDLLMRLIAQKEGEALEETSLDELKERLDKLLKR